MENKLKKMFDYQLFSGNSRLESMMKDAESRYPEELSDEDLFLVNAAGEGNIQSPDAHSILPENKL